MRAADMIVDMGPHAGERGGEVVAAGTPQEIMMDARSLTGAYLSGKIAHRGPRRAARPVRAGDPHRGGGPAQSEGDRRRIPPRHARLCHRRQREREEHARSRSAVPGIETGDGGDGAPQGSYRLITGHEQISNVELVDQSPIGRTPRSNPVTYIQVFDQIRALFAATQSAKIHGYTPGMFSFNVPGGDAMNARGRRCQGRNAVSCRPVSSV